MAAPLKTTLDTKIETLPEEVNKESIYVQNSIAESILDSSAKRGKADC